VPTRRLVVRSSRARPWRARGEEAHYPDLGCAGVPGVPGVPEGADGIVVATAYRERYGIPLITCVREVGNVEQLRSLGRQRMHNSVTQEHAAALIEIAKIAKIANHRFDDLVADANPVATARTRRLDRVADPAGRA
jgi:hypothetical protein